MMEFQDPQYEAQGRVLAGIYHHGKVFLERSRNILTDECFENIKFQFLYRCFKYILETMNVSIDSSNILTYAHNTGQHHFVTTRLLEEFIPDILGRTRISIEDALNYARHLRRIVVRKSLKKTLQFLIDDIDKETCYTPIESTTTKIYDLLSNMTLRTVEGDGRKPTHIGEGLQKYVKELTDNPVKIMGLSTGYSELDEVVGGLRPGSITVIGSRIKTGKTTLLTNIGMNVAKTGVPVLFLDVEMVKTEVTNKLLAREAGVNITLIETGRAVYDEDAYQSLVTTAQRLEESKDQVPYYYINISDMTAKSFLSVVEEWIIQHVGVTSEGKAKECLILLDYLTLTVPDLKDQKSPEYQQMGQLMREISSMAVRYEIPFVTTVQLNREGVDDETMKSVSQSDRIGWVCTSFVIFKQKSPKEIAEDDSDGIHKGNRKIVPVVARFAKECDPTNYISLEMRGEYARITEKGRKWAFTQARKTGNGFVQTIDATAVPGSQPTYSPPPSKYSGFTPH